MHADRRGLSSAIYRTIELADGFDGRIIQTEVYFSEATSSFVLALSADPRFNRRP